MPIKFVFKIACIAVASLFPSVFPVSCIIAFSKVKVFAHLIRRGMCGMGWNVVNEADFKHASQNTLQT